MELTIDQALQQGVAAHKEGKLQEAERLHRAILQAQPAHPDANHNLGVIAVSVNKAGAALPLFKTALEANPKIEQFWLSYIDALIRMGELKAAGTSIDEATQKGFVKEKLESLAVQLEDKRKTLLEHLIKLYQANEFQRALEDGSKLSAELPGVALIPNLMGLCYAGLDQLEEAKSQYTKAIQINPAYFEAHNNLGVALKRQGMTIQAITSYRKAIEIQSENLAVQCNLAVALAEMGLYTDSEKVCLDILEVDPKLAEAHTYLGTALAGKGSTADAKASYKKALKIKPNSPDAYYNLHGIASNIDEAISFLQLGMGLEELEEFHLTRMKTRHMLIGLKGFKGDFTEFNHWMGTKLSTHPYMSSFDWLFSLGKLPSIYFDRLQFFDAVIKNSDKTRPFYEFGVWMGASFKYLMRSYTKGCGFDTFEGLPEGWRDGAGKGAYSNNGNVPQIKGGEFIVGTFEDTLPTFFSKKRPLASLINLDADLYSSTLCALVHSKEIIDSHTILVFDEFLLNPGWQNDEFKALNEFCGTHGYDYEVIAVSLFTKQVAVRLNRRS